MVDTKQPPPSSSASAPEGGGTNTSLDAQTLPQQSTGDGLKEPHERDESATSQGQQTDDNQTVMDQARKDVESGQQDTSKRPVTHDTYARQTTPQDDDKNKPPRA